jgi:hypothetical protein
MIVFTTIENITMIIIGTAARIAPIVVRQKRTTANTGIFQDSKSKNSKLSGVGVTSIRIGVSSGNALVRIY